MKPFLVLIAEAHMVEVGIMGSMGIARQRLELRKQKAEMGRGGESQALNRQ
jgi:hypothetical protein